jgi:hypothetical protein
VKSQPEQPLLTAPRAHPVANIEEWLWQQLVVLQHADQAGLLDHKQAPATASKAAKINKYARKPMTKFIYDVYRLLF